MGCCMSSDTSRIYEVVLDHNGVARRVSEGQGTHLIHVSKHKETRMEQKPDFVLSTLSRPPSAYSRVPKMVFNPPTAGKRVSPITDEKEPKV